MNPLFLALMLFAAAEPDTAVIQLKEVVVSATKTRREAVSVPNATTTVTGAELRRRGTHFLADALQDMVGVDTGNGSDNGMRLPNVGLWGLKEFDALLFTLDGAPVGGPFNPELHQIPVEDLDRIEVVKGPQGTMYGVSAFAGMVQAFSRTDETPQGNLTLGGSSFSNFHGFGSVQRRFNNGTQSRLNANFSQGDGWQDRTGTRLERGGLTANKAFGEKNVGLDLFGYRDRQYWGTPLPYDAGEVVPGFKVDRNYAIADATQEHKVLGASSRASLPLGLENTRLENTLSFTNDRQVSIRSIPGPPTGTGDDFESEVVSLRPTENTVFEDLRAVSHFQGGGSHELVLGAAVTWGQINGDGFGADFEQSLEADYGVIPTSTEIPIGDNRTFEDRRTFFGFYAHDEWTPREWVTVGGGGRYDNAEEKLHVSGQEVGGPLELAEDSRTDREWSGDASLMVRIPTKSSTIDNANAYVNYKSAFKPAAPNLSEAEGAEILDPEWSHSIEGGFKLRAFERASLNFSIFQMDLENMVVSILGAGGTPELTNAGHERFKGYEVDLGWTPAQLPAAKVSAGYAHHDARFVEFTFLRDGTTPTNVSGNHLELVPEEMVNAKLEYAPVNGVGGFVTIRYQGERFLNRRNTFITDAYTEWDAGGSFNLGRAMLVVTGRNLGDDRHPVAESEIGDSMFYISPPRRVTVELSSHF